VKPNNEASLKSVQSSIQPDGQFIHPVIRLFTATLNPSRRPDGPSFFLGGFVFCGSSSSDSEDTTHRATFKRFGRPENKYLGLGQTRIKFFLFFVLTKTTFFFF
jgi:hypothetical protein